MSKIKYVIGDLLSAPEIMVAHGCNAQGVMNSGVAKAIRQKWPGAYQVYRKHYEDRIHHGRILVPGEVIWATVDGKLIANCITQNNYGYNGKLYTNYNAIRECMQTINKFEYAELGLAMPLIGAGLGGGDWKIISKIIEEEITHCSPTVYVLESDANKISYFS